MDRQAFKVTLTVGLIAVSLFSTHIASAQLAPNPHESRGELLYSTHCIGCHTTEIHWRDKKLATDWAALKDQVRRWSSNTGLAWGDDDIVLVTRHLNALYYHFPVAGQQTGSSGPSSLPVSVIRSPARG